MINECTQVANVNPPYGKRWRLYILPQYLAHLTEPLAHVQSHMFTQVIPVLTKLCMQDLKFLDLFCVFLWAVLGFSCAKNYG